MSQKVNKKKLRGAIDFRDYQGVKQLLSDSDNIDAIIDGSDTILHYATRSGYLEIVEEIISKSPDINMVNDQGQTPLHCVTSSASWFLVKRAVL